MPMLLSLLVSPFFKRRLTGVYFYIAADLGVVTTVLVGIIFWLFSESFFCRFYIMISVIFGGHGLVTSFFQPDPSFFFEYSSFACLINLALFCLSMNWRMLRSEVSEEGHGS